MDTERAKQAAGIAAASCIEPLMTVGLGTGSTAAHFIRALAVRMDRGLKIKAAVPSSKASSDLAKQLGLPTLELNEVFSIDIAVDGADEIDPSGRMIKGGGGAHVREKILAAASREFIVIADASKLVKKLGAHKLPLEVLSYGAHFTALHLESLGYRGSWRMKSDRTRFLSDNGNFIYDIAFPHLLSHPEEDQARISQVPGVVDTGFFLKPATRLIIGYPDGRTETISP